MIKTWTSCGRNSVLLFYVGGYSILRGVEPARKAFHFKQGGVTEREEECDESSYF